MKVTNAKLGDVIELLTDYHANGSYEKLKENVELLHDESYAVMIRTTNFSQNNFTDNLNYITEEAYNYLNKSKVFPNDIIMNKIADAGACYFMPDIDRPVSLGMNLFLIRIKDQLADPFFVFNYLKFHEHYVKSFASGSATKTITKDDTRKLKIYLPELKAQQKIAKILSTWDKAISTTEHLIENSTQQKKALMQQLLTGKKRLLDESGKRFEGEWEEFKLSEITDFIRDGTHGTHKRYESGIPMLSAKNITKQNTVDFDDAPYISEDDYNKIHARYTIKSGDILLTVVGTLGRVALVPEELAEKFTLQRSVAIIRVAKGICNQFLMQLFSSSDFTHLLHRKSNSTAQAGVYLGELGKLKILLPSFEEQQKIATVLTNADKEIELLEQQLADLQQEKKALMQVLLTGKKRVVVDG